MEKTMYFNSENGQVYTAKVTLSNNAMYAKIGKDGYYVDDEKKEARVKYNTKYALPKSFEKINWNVPILLSVAKGRSVRAKAFTDVPDSTDMIWTLTESGQLKYVEFKKISFVDSTPVAKKAPEKPVMTVVPKDEPGKPIPQNSEKAQKILKKNGIDTSPKPEMTKEQAEEIQEDSNIQDVFDYFRAIETEKDFKKAIDIMNTEGYSLFHKQSQKVMHNVRFEKGRKFMVIKGDTEDGKRTFKALPRAVSRYFTLHRVTPPCKG